MTDFLQICSNSMCGFLVFVCAQNTGSDYRLYIMVSDLFLEKRSEKILVPFSIFSSFLSFFLPLFMCSFLLLLIYSVFHFCHRNFFSSSYFVLPFIPLFLFCCHTAFVQCNHRCISSFILLSSLSKSICVFFVICNFFQLSCTCLFFTIVHDFVLSFFLSLSPLYQQQITQVILSSHTLFL